MSGDSQVEHYVSVAAEFCMACGGEGQTPIYIGGKMISVEVCRTCGGTGDANTGFDDVLGEVHCRILGLGRRRKQERVK
jgi:DnaJ-class molecular chaperone